MLVQNLASLFEDHGFKKQVARRSIVTKTKEGKASIHLGFIDHADDFDVITNFAIRLDAVEDILNEIDDPMISKKKLVTYTLGAELGNTSNGKQKRWTIRNEEDVKLAVREIYLDTLSIFFPIIEKYATKESVYDLAVKDDEEANALWAFPYDRARCAVVLANVLQKDYDTRMAIIRKKEEFLKNIDDPHIDWFMEFVERFK